MNTKDFLRNTVLKNIISVRKPHAMSLHTMKFPKFNYRLEQLLVILPGIFFMCLGLAVLVAPKLILLLIACFFVTFGLLACSVALKILALKRKIEIFSSQIEARLIIEPGKTGSMQSGELLDSKKVVFH